MEILISQKMPRMLEKLAFFLLASINFFFNSTTSVAKSLKITKKLYKHHRKIRNRFPLRTIETIYIQRRPETLRQFLIINYVLFTHNTLIKRYSLCLCIIDIHYLLLPGLHPKAMVARRLRMFY